MEASIAAGVDPTVAAAQVALELDAYDATLPGFAIDRAPVTVREYAEFVRATGRPGPTAPPDADALARGHAWSALQAPARYLAHPVVLVDHAEASAYCRWRGLRLPLEEEWERAARGVDGRIFPWGDEYDPTRLDDRVFGPGDTTPVLTFHRGLSPEGVADMAGNVRQWTDSPGRQPGTFIVRGSAWDEPRGSGRVAARRERDATRGEATLGFRCATREAP